jgi:molecular chaperone GrpE
MGKKNKEQEFEETISQEAGVQDSTGDDVQPAEKAGETLEEQSPADRYEAELAREKDKFLRLFAEFENYKKRTSRERMELFKTAGQEVIAS